MPNSFRDTNNDNVINNLNEKTSFLHRKYNQIYHILILSIYLLKRKNEESTKKFLRKEL